jgi:hypothetical protein
MNAGTNLSNEEKGRERAPNGRFLRGWRGGPGRPPGRPNRGSVDARIIKSVLLDSWNEYGPDALRRVAEDDPATYLRLVVALLPREDVAAEFTSPLLPGDEDRPAVELIEVIQTARRLVAARKDSIED